MGARRAARPGNRDPGGVRGAAIGAVSSTSQFHAWPDSSAATTFATISPLARSWNTWSFTYTDPKTNHKLTNAAAYAAAIRDRYYSVIILGFQDTGTMDQAIQQDMKRYHDYRLVAKIPFTTSTGPGSRSFWAPASQQSFPQPC